MAGKGAEAAETLSAMTAQPGYPVDLDLCSPRGFFSFPLSETNALLAETTSGIIFENYSKKHYFRLQRDETQTISFFHSCPAAGTHRATVDIASILGCLEALFILEWSYESVTLRITTKERVTLIGSGSSSEVRYYLNGAGLVEITDPLNEISNVRSFDVEMRPEFKPPAIELWWHALSALDLHLSGKSEKGYMFELCQANNAIVMLVTGLEEYLSVRFQEIELEGNEPNVEKLYRKCFNDDGFESLRRQHPESLLGEIVRRSRLTFQGYDQFKKLYLYTYGIRVSELLGQDDLELMRRAIAHRHRVVHVDPLHSVLGIERQRKNRPQEIIPMTLEVCNRVRVVIDRFVTGLHQATMTL